ncbi:LppP/LprE family lipoprotein [Corynebacterium sp. sy039]|uniref:LppP/LprE family lipoprotein n=1 Tax=Corynebacterium sp. sy039 TaxID=2599641 RepID=UPI0011B4AD62|nr:LppP/LprE family lipoprotein [Corynebacterium sp. sy039]QDZ42763.1 LppP/LprE family lipoprotein [Corynebacterium sp. sy039]
MRSHTLKTASILTLCALALSACSTDILSRPTTTTPAPAFTVIEQSDTEQRDSETQLDDEEENNEPVTPENGDDSQAIASPSPQRTTSSGSSCPDTATGSTILARAVAETLPGSQDGWSWDVQGADTSTYDPCATLSWIVVGVRNVPENQAPYHITLYKNGKYLGTATFEPYPYYPQVQRTSDRSISVTYSWDSGKSYASFTWSNTQEKIVMEGDVPPSN